MLVDVTLTADTVEGRDVDGRTAVVIDVLRASSTVVTALANGCREVIPVATPEEAFAFKQVDTAGYLLGGERGAVKIPGFDLGNSPSEYTREVVGGRGVVLTTTNGTKTLLRVSGAERVLVGCFLNAAAVARSVAAGPGLVLACAGTKGRFSLEDFAAAGAILAELPGDGLENSDLAMAALATYRQLLDSQGLVDTLSRTGHGKDLDRLGFTEDITYCAKVNMWDVVPEYRAGAIRKASQE